MDWFRSYLKDRTQRAYVGGQFSDSLSITYGVPQGSVSGSLLFLLYINDIPQASKGLGFHLFADDTSLFFSHPNLNVIGDWEMIGDWERSVPQLRAYLKILTTGTIGWTLASLCDWYLLT